MKFYTSNSPESVNSQLRDPAEVIIPPFHFKGTIVAEDSDKWPVTVDCEITGGVAMAPTVGLTALTVLVFKSNVYEQDLVIGEFTIPALGGRAPFVPVNQMMGTLNLSKFDYINVSTRSSSGHEGLVVQLQARRVN